MRISIMRINKILRDFMILTLSCHVCFTLAVECYPNLVRFLEYDINKLTKLNF